MLTVEEIQKKLSDRTLSTVADRTGLSYPTVYNLAKGISGDGVEYNTVKKLSDYLEQQ